jgi:hypothetical protein
MANAESPAPAVMPDKPPRPKRWIPLSLRLFFGIHLSLGIGGALWLGISAYRQHAALRGIGINRFNVGIDLQRVGPDWLRQWIGNERLQLFDKVVGVRLADDRITDADLAHLKGLPDLQTLYLTGTSVTDEGLSELQGLSKLRTLSLDGTQFTDEGLKPLGRLKNLEYLNLKDSQVTDLGLVHLKELANLKCLQVFPRPLTKAGVRNWKLTRSRTAWPVYVPGVAHLEQPRQNPGDLSSGGMSLSTGTSGSGE